MKAVLQQFATFLLAFFLGTLWGVMVGMLHGQLRAALIAWLAHVLIFWVLFARFRLFRYSGFLLAPPLALLAFQILWQAQHPVIAVADDYLSSDRSHYRPNTRIISPTTNRTDPKAYGWNEPKIFIGRDGFRADPDTGQGNPERCRYVMIGDSMIYGSGLPYQDTARPLLVRRGLDACVFGVPGNSPPDYLSTLEYVADRIQPDAHVAFYLYAYNDFIDVKKFMTRSVRGTSKQFRSLYAALERFDNWRRTTVTFAWFHTKENKPRAMQALWQYDVNETHEIAIRYPHDPQFYKAPKTLAMDERYALQLFFDAVARHAAKRSWKISIVIHPDDAEIYANLARRNKNFAALDPRRADALALCQAMPFRCADISELIYQKTLAEGENAYFTDDRHFSRFGMGLIADHFTALNRAATARPIHSASLN